MTDDQQLIADARGFDYRAAALAEFKAKGMNQREALAAVEGFSNQERKSAAMTIEDVLDVFAELVEEETGEPREEARARAATALSAAAVRYRAEGIERAAEVAASSTLPLRRGWDLNTGSRSQWYANGVRDAAARVRALLDENNETQEN